MDGDGVTSRAGALQIEAAINRVVRPRRPLINCCRSLQRGQALVINQ